MNNIPTSKSYDKDIASLQDEASALSDKVTALQTQVKALQTTATVPPPATNVDPESAISTNVLYTADVDTDGATTVYDVPISFRCQNELDTAIKSVLFYASVRVKPDWTDDTTKIKSVTLTDSLGWDVAGGSSYNWTFLNSEEPSFSAGQRKSYSLTLEVIFSKTNPYVAPPAGNTFTVTVYVKPIDYKLAQ